jgi:hypothetical protein
VIPALILAGLNAYNLWNEHWEHWSHMPPLEERVEYPYQNIRTKNFPWGDGDKTLLYVPFNFLPFFPPKDSKLTHCACVAGMTVSTTTTRTRPPKRNNNIPNG